MSRFPMLSQLNIVSILGEGESQYADVSQLRASYNVYKAVYAIAYAIQDMVACRPGDRVFNGGQCPDIRKLQPSQVRTTC